MVPPDPREIDEGSKARTQADLRARDVSPRAKWQLDDTRSNRDPAQSVDFHVTRQDLDIEDPTRMESFLHHLPQRVVHSKQLGTALRVIDAKG